MLAIRHGDDELGRVERLESSWGRAATSSCWSIAIGVDAGMRGRGIGWRAQVLLAEYLFAHIRAERVQAYTDVDNVAERKALVRSLHRMASSTEADR
ncbi:MULTISPECIES: GNAT family N-acetyltransferase [unclassified Rathayibacter]|uniref:GNAT family N-acetyltransferase n=1 Tax=unclassified Rathayibacter TaxID=2609250 RepID=UPI00188B11EA|nr:MULTISPECIES: GNAT family protein [unclassified Rathayibacter]MBF4462085.1 GNAT family N-acetyltransferase [Rathayibacter sp. VKM Ac-2879]MBF4503872.1 GNAT family N-acetyltransferase [Rathayibacter sp. VKM Ac-2878]